MKKGFELSANLIVVMILALLILVILAFILSGGFRNLTGTTESCSARSGECRESCNLLSELTIKETSDCSDTQVCCVPIMKSTCCCCDASGNHFWTLSETNCENQQGVAVADYNCD